MNLYVPTRPIPDNLWFSLSILAVSAALLIGNWNAGVELFSVGPLPNSSESLLLEGNSALVLDRLLYSALSEDFDLLFNRLLSSLGCLLTLGMLLRLLVRVGGFAGAMPSMIVLTCQPGWVMNQCAAASGSLGFFLFLLGLSRVLFSEDGKPFWRSGVWMALSILWMPVMLLPVLGCLPVIWERQRQVLKSFLISFVLTLLLLLGFMLFFQPQWFQSFRQPALETAAAELLQDLVQGYPLLLGALLLLLLCGWKQRGVVWWGLLTALLTALPLFVVHPFTRMALAPLGFFVALSLARIPRILDIPHPRIYQSLLLAQLLLWLPALYLS